MEQEEIKYIRLAIKLLGSKVSELKKQIPGTVDVSREKDLKLTVYNCTKFLDNKTKMKFYVTNGKVFRSSYITKLELRTQREKSEPTFDYEFMLIQNGFETISTDYYSGEYRSENIKSSVQFIDDMEHSNQLRIDFNFENK